jgi:hypothetical protein
MIFIFADDQTLDVVNGLEEVRRNCEGIDVENKVFRFFDENGNHLEPRFTSPNRKGRDLGIFSWVESGEYELIPSPSAYEDDIFLWLLKTTGLESNSWFETLDDVKGYLESRAKRFSDEGSS